MSWKPVVYNGESYKGLYEANENGEIRSLNYRHTNVPSIMKPNFACRGYGKLWLSRDGKKVMAIVSRIIAETFIPNPQEKPCVDHIDTNKRNNCASNLRWVTPFENSHNKITLEKFHFNNSGKNARFFGKFGMEHNRSKPVFCESTKIFFGSTREVERKTGILRGCISSCCNGKTKIAGGFRWRWSSRSEIKLNAEEE